MNRYGIGEGGEEAFEPGSDGLVLRNRLHITDSNVMDVAEARALAMALEKGYTTFEDTTPLSVPLLCEMHSWWLGELYDFAGKIRTVDVSKNGVMFAPAAFLESTLRDLDGLLAANTPCTGCERANLVRATALVHGELVLAHPFREGNGRLARWAADLMVVQAGWQPLDWGFEVDDESKREDYFAALRKAFAKQFGPLETLISEALARS